MATDIEIFIGTSLDFLLSFKVKKTNDVSAIDLWMCFPVQDEHSNLIVFLGQICYGTIYCP